MDYEDGPALAMWGRGGMVDAQDLKSWERYVREGSTPSVPTIAQETKSL